MLHVKYISMTFWFLLHRKKQHIATLWRTWLSIVSGQIVTLLLSLCITKWLCKWRWGWSYVHSNAKNTKSLIKWQQDHTTVVMHKCSIGFVLWSVWSWFKTVKHDRVDLVTVDYDTTLCWRIVTELRHASSHKTVGVPQNFPTSYRTGPGHTCLPIRGITSK